MTTGSSSRGKKTQFAPSGVARLETSAGSATEREGNFRQPEGTAAS